MDSLATIARSVLDEHSGEMLILLLTILILVALVILVPQLLRANARKVECRHEERLRALERGLPLPIDDDRSRVAGRTALVVPMVVMIAAATVTCFLIAYKSENVFAVSLGVWVVAGTVSLAAITGGVALIGRLAMIQARQEDDDEEEEEVAETSDFR